MTWPTSSPLASSSAHVARRPREPVAPKGRPDPGRREPLWDRVDANRLKLAGYVALFVVSAVVVFDLIFLVFGGCLLAFALAGSGRWGVLEGVSRSPLAALAVVSAMFAAIALGWALFTLARSEKWLLRRLGATFVAKGELIDTKMALKDMAIAAGAPVAPALYLIENTTVNAFVFSAKRRRAVVGVTRGLVDKLSVDEQRAVFANLVARLASGDTIVSTGVAALMWPLQAWRDRTLDVQNEEMDREFTGLAPRETAAGSLLFFGFAMAIVGELFAFWQRRGQLRSAEKADAEGMLLLKEPQAMLSALERCVYYDNVVPQAGETFGDLFYCWTGDSTNDEDDPEWERVARLREVLGVEGHVPAEEPVLSSVISPVAPRVDSAPQANKPPRAGSGL